jgi:hypothetical protein
MEGVTHDTDKLKAVGEHVLKVNKGAYLSYRVEPIWNDANRFMENEEVLVRVTSSNGRTKQGKVPPGEPSRFTEIPQQQGWRQGPGTPEFHGSRFDRSILRVDPDTVSLNAVQNCYSKWP